MVCLLVTLGAAPAWSSERRLAYTYESSVLPASARELEVWTTWRAKRDDYYSRFDLRAEFEIGLTQRLQTALYLNAQMITAPVNSELGSAFTFEGVSSEWKYKLLDPVADPIGLALYLELTGKPDELEIEGKVIIDKKVGAVLFAANLVAENEWAFEPNETESELALELNLGATYFFTDKLSAGLELRSLNQFGGDGAFEYSALYAGPVIAYAEKMWWVVLAVQPQLPALKRSDALSALVLDSQERVNARLLFSMHL
jgi:hypothetical protein